MKNIWQDTRRPFLVQAPLENVSDTVFRQILVKVGRPDILFTEFTSVEGLCSQGKNSLLKKFQFTPQEQPLIAQVWGNTPEKYIDVGRMIVAMGFSGMDINMGCPDRAIVQKGACSGLMRNRALVKKIIAAAKEGLGGKIPLSVKTRIGYDKIETEEWIGFLLTQGLDAITIHARTVSEMSKVPAHWDEIGKAVALRNTGNFTTAIIGNGDIKSREEAFEKVAQHGVEGVMIGRGMLHDMWVFNKQVSAADMPTEQKLQLLVDHITLFQETWGETKHFDVMRKFYKVYVSGLPDANEFRMQLMECRTPGATIALLRMRIAQAG